MTATPSGCRNRIRSASGRATLVSLEFRRSLMVVSGRWAEQPLAQPGFARPGLHQDLAGHAAGRITQGEGDDDDIIQWADHPAGTPAALLREIAHGVAPVLQRPSIEILDHFWEWISGRDSP
jgi:hypothetical protein